LAAAHASAVDAVAEVDVFLIGYLAVGPTENAQSFGLIVIRKLLARTPNSFWTSALDTHLPYP
jgi:hypothetical protein